MSLFCKFKIPEPLGFIDVDADEPTVKEYIRKIISEFRQGNAILISASEFSDDLWHSHHEPHEQPQAVTFVRVMLGITVSDGPGDNTKLLTQKAMEVLQGENLQITHTEQRGAETHIGFTQM
jgi:hypothetical protein